MSLTRNADNEYIVTVTSWLPKLKRDGTPRYRAIALALASDIGAGRMKPGTRLPTHRELADRLGVTVGTVTRAYGEAARRGLVSGEVGRGTFTRAAPSHAARPASSDGNPVIDMSVNIPPPPFGIDEDELLSRTLAALAQRDDLAGLLSYPLDAGRPEHREAGARFIAYSGLHATPERVLVSSGSQHAMTAVFSALTQPGDVVLTEQLTYQGMKALANLLHLNLQGLPIDEHGLRPEAFEVACRSGAKFLYCVPTLHNPTTAIMPPARRAQLAEIAIAHDVLIVEDDVYGLLLDEPVPALSSFAPETSIYLTGAAKVMAAGLRVGFMFAPRALVGKLAAAIRTTTWMAAPLMVEIAADWIRDGIAERLIAGRRAEAAARQRIAQRVLCQHHAVSHPNAFHLWLRLSSEWQSDALAEAARRRGAPVAPRSQFLVSPKSGGGDAVRVSLGAARSREELERGCEILADLLAQPPTVATLAAGP
jgi:DNA-binding transcriptional MocR family regulator